MPALSAAEIASALERFDQTVCKAIRDGTVMTMMGTERQAMVSGFVTTSFS